MRKKTKPWKGQDSGPTSYSPSVTGTETQIIWLQSGILARLLLLIV